MLERTLRKHVAQRLLTHVVPALLGELLEAAADDLSPTTADDPLSELESQADADLRTVESVERCKAALDAAGLREKDGAPPSPSLFRQRLTRASLAADREAVSAGVRHDAAAAVHTHRSTATGSEP